MTRGALGCLVLVAACGGARVAPTTTAPVVRDPRRYFPLEAGMVWSYEVDTGEAMTTLGTMRVLSVDAEGAHVATNRVDAVRTYVATADGVRRADAEGFVLAAPLDVGATFRGEEGRDARIDATDASVRTGMGELRDCVRVVSVGGSLGNVITATYCPDVGLASLVTSLASPSTGETIELRATLIGLTRDVGAATSGGTTVDVVPPR